MPGSRFNDELVRHAFTGPDDPVVIAAGPLAPNETVIEICAWVYQDNGENEAAATEMSTKSPGALTQGPEFWRLPLGKVGDTDLQDGPAFAVGVALLRVSGTPPTQKFVWWGHPVTLIPGTAGA